MATAAAVERFKAAGKQQLNCWIDSDVATVLKALSVQRSQSYGDILRDALIALHSGQPVAPVAPAIGGGDSLDRLSMSVTGLHEDITSLRSIVSDWSSAFESRLSDLQDNLEARLSAVEATINAAPVLPIPSNNYTPETPVLAAPGANEAPGKKPYNRAPDSEIEERRKLFIELHNAGNSTSQISHAVRAKGFSTGTSPAEIDKYLRSKGLTPNRMRG